MTVMSEGRGQVPEMTPCGDTEKSPRWDLTGTPRNRTTPTPSRPPTPSSGLQNQIIFGRVKRCTRAGCGAVRVRTAPPLRMGDLLLAASRDRLPPASRRGRASGHTGAQAGLWGPVVAAPIPRPATPGPVWRGAGPFSPQRLTAFGNMWPVAGRQHGGKTQSPDQHSRGGSFRTAIFSRDIFLVSKNRSGCGNPRRRTEGGAAEAAVS